MTKINNDVRKMPPSGWWIGPALVISAAMWIGAIWALAEVML